MGQSTTQDIPFLSVDNGSANFNAAINEQAYGDLYEVQFFLPIGAFEAATLTPLFSMQTTFQAAHFTFNPDREFQGISQGNLSVTLSTQAPV